MRRRSLPLAVGFAACAACSLFTPLDGLTTSAAEAEDAGPAGAADAALEAAADRASVDAGGGCASLGAHAFCADFDDSVAVTDGWDSFADPPGTGELERAFFVSPPQSARLRVGANSPACSSAQLQKRFTGSFTKVTMAWSVRVGTASGAIPSGSQSVGAVGIARQCSVFLNPFGSGPGVYRQDDPSGSPGEFHPLPAAIATGQWHRVKLAFSTQASPHIVVEIDGATSLTVTTLPTSCQLTGRADVEVGLHCSRSAAADTEVRVDDVVVDVE